MQPCLRSARRRHVSRPSGSALLGVIAYLIAAMVAEGLPLLSLLIICALPVFYGMTGEGWKD